MNRRVIRIRLQQAGLVRDQARTRLLSRVVAQLVVVIHLDSIKRAKLRAIAAVHADRRVDVEIFRLRHRSLRNRVLRAFDPDALRRTHLGADAA